MYQGFNTGQYPYAGLGDFWSDISNVADKIANVASQAGQVGRQVGAVAAGDKKVVFAPSSGSYGTFAVPGQPYGVTFPLMPIAIGVAGLVAWSLLRRR